MIGLALLGAALLLPMLAFGGQHAPTIALGAACAAGAAAVLGRKLARLSRLALLFLALVGYTALQLVPLPLGLVAILAPASADVWSNAFRPFHEAPPGWVTLSVDPAGTAIEILKWSAYACVIVAGAGARMTRGSALIAGLLFGSALVVCVITLVHGVVNAERVYGLYRPLEGGRWIRGPLVNGNNLAGYLNLGLFSGAGLWLGRPGIRFRYALGFGLPLLACGVVLTGSRGGVGALVVGALAFVVAAFWSRRDLGLRVVAVAAGLGALAVAALVVLGGERLILDLTALDFWGKTAAWVWSLELVRDYPVFGAGRGAFETAFPPYRGTFDFEFSSVFSHPENLLVQWVSEWGPFVGIAGLAGVALLARRGWSKILRDPLAAGLWIGLGVLVLQNLVDMSLELFAVGCAAALVLSTAEDAAANASKQSTWKRAAPIIAVVLASLTVLALRAQPVQVDRRKLARAYRTAGTAAGAAPRAVRSELRAAMGRHPGEAYFPLVGALLALKAKDQDPWPWVARALERSPRYGAAHLTLAEVLHQRGRTQQALIHLRLAARYDIRIRELALARAAVWSKSITELASGFREGAEGGELFWKLCDKVSRKDRVVCWREALRREPNNERVMDQLLEALVEAVEGGEPSCIGSAEAGCIADGQRLFAVLSRRPTSFRAAHLGARLLARQGDHRSAVAMMLSGCPAIQEARGCLERAVDLAAGLPDLAPLKSAGDRLLAVLCSQPAECALAHERIGRKYAERQTWGAALGHFNAAAKEEPTGKRWLDVADTAARAGAASAARTAIQRALLSGQLSDDEKRRVESIETELRQAPLAP